ncbi:MAG: TetR/AcrR family transcriptional regulator [Polyangiales bacterium]
MTATAPRKRRSPKEARRLLVEAARAALLEGAGDLEMLDVARRAGVSEGLAYYHFGSKAGLLDSVIRDFYDRLDEAVLAVSFVGDSWIDRERARTYEFVRLMYEDPVALLVVNVVRADPGVQAEERDRRRRLVALGARNITEAQWAGEVDRTYDSKLLIAMVLAGTMAGVTEALAASPRRPLSQTQRDVWSFVLRAVGLPDTPV